MTARDLLTASETPRTDAATIKSETDERLAGELVSADVSRALERELRALTAIAESMAEGLKRGPFDSEHDFAIRRLLTYDEWLAHLKAYPAR